jgi:hypothetical protein
VATLPMRFGTTGPMTASKGSPYRGFGFSIPYNSLIYRERKAWGLGNLSA